MKSSASFYRVCLSAVALAGVAATPAVSKARSQTENASQRQNEGSKSSSSGRHRFADGFFVGRFRRSGMFSSLTLGFSNCAEGRNGAKCSGPIGASGKVKSSFAFTKEFGYRIPWALFGASYSLAFMRPSWNGSAGTALADVGYQHTLLAVIRPTLPIWRVDLGFTVAPGWSRQVFRGPEWSDRRYTQGFALGLGVVASAFITQGWVAGLRWDIIKNYHSKACASSSDVSTKCVELGEKVPAAFNVGMTGLFLSHRW